MKNSRMKFVTAPTMLIATVGLLAACSAASPSSSAGGQNGERIAFMGLAAQNTYTQSAYEAAKKVVEADGGTVAYFDGQFKSDVQYNQLLDIATSGKYDGVLVMANDGASIAPAVSKAVASGLKVIAVEFPVGADPTDLEPQIDGVVSTVGYSVVTEAATWADRVVDACVDKDPCNVAWLMGDRTTLFDKLRWDTITKTIAQHPTIDIVTAVDMHWDRNEGLAAGKTILTSHPDDLDVITGADIGLMGATDALQTADKVKDVALIGFGTTTDGVMQVRNGIWDSSAGVHQPADEGALAAQMIIDSLSGKTVKTSVNMIDESPIGPVATKETLEKDPTFIGQWN